MLKLIATVLLILVGLIALIALVGAQLPVQHTVTRTATLAIPPQQLWDIISGPPTWRPEVQRYEVLASSPAHREWREYGRHGQKITYEVVHSDPPRKLITRIADPHLPFGGTWTYEVAAAENGSTLTITENGEVYNPIFRFISRYIQGYGATLDNYLGALQTRIHNS